MKKKTIQLSKKLFLRKEDISPLNPVEQQEVVGGYFTQVNCVTIVCATQVISACNNCFTIANCPTQNVVCNVSRRITPGCG